MQEMRIALTVLPVGPRGQAAIVENEPLWFALQIAAGFKDKETVTADLVKSLWPWNVHVKNGDRVGVNAWIGNTPVTVDDAVIGDDDFAKKLRDAIETAYGEKKLWEALDLRMLLPKDAATQSGYEENSFPARVQYLATLPGELSRRLLSTLYLKFDDVTKLFTKNINGQWESNGVLFLAPKQVKRASDVTLNGPPASSVDDRLEVTGKDTDGLVIRAIGPGFDLDRFANPQPDVFDLTGYALDVNAGDRRFVELETILLDARDPFAQIATLRDRAPREMLVLVDTSSGRRVIPQETFVALAELWLVRSLAQELVALFPDVLRRLQQFLVPSDATKLEIPARWESLAVELDVAVQPLLDVAARLAVRLGAPAPDKRSMLRAVAERSSFGAVAALVAQAFDETVSATAGAVKLAEAWRFGNPASAVLAERRVALAQAALRELREQRLVPAVYDALTAGKITDDAELLVRATLVESITREWKARRESNVIAALETLGLASRTETKLDDTGFDAAEAEAHVTTVWPATPAAQTELPGRGLSLVIGDTKRRVTHEKQAEDPASAYREIAGVLIFGRRSSISKEDLEDQPWRILTAGTAFVGSLEGRVFAPGQDPEITTEEWFQGLLPIPLRPVFQQKVVRADVEYHGQPMLTESPLDQAYQSDKYADEEGAMEVLPDTFTYQPVGNFSGDVPDEAKASKTPPLRYGDHYEFRARLIDQAGGLSKDVAGAEPWRFDLKLPKLLPDVLSPIEYLRRVPVGEANILPSKAPNAKKAEWPAIPEDVALRVREWWALTHDGAESVPALLFSENQRFRGTRAEYSFTVEAPSIDEHTLQRWAFPKVGDGDGEAKIKKLRRALTMLFEQRLIEKVHPLQDPAVTAFGIRIRGADAGNRVDDNLFHDIIKLAERTDAQGERIDFQYEPLAITVTCTGAKVTAVANGQTLKIGIPETCFAAVEVFPLVTESEFNSRFAAMSELVDEEAGFAGHVAFRASVLLLEGATDALPSLATLHEHLLLEPQTESGNVAVRFRASTDVKDLIFVDRFAVERERWAWRNLPVVPEKLPLPANPDYARRIASGPPAKLFDGDHADPSVADWETIAGLDRGFVDRGRVTGRWPRVAPENGQAGGPGRDVLLTLDDRDAVAAADYLRFALRARSRYAGVLPAELEKSATRRRLTMPFRGGDRIKPPKILAVVPLTASLEDDPLKHDRGVTPFLVLLDETFFREYGVGERLEARLTRVNLDIGEDPKAPVPYRTGPLPDHYLPRKESGDGRYYTGQLIEEGKELALEVFGPFGYSLDITPSEALANATAWIVYAPKDVGAHWGMFVRFRRLLDRPSPGTASDWSDAYALYTLPDERLLAAQTSGALLSIAAGRTEATLQNLRLVLDPIEQSKNSAAASQYRYFLLVSRVIAGAGQGFDAELPAALWRIKAPKDGYIAEGTFDVDHGSDEMPLEIEELTPDAGMTKPEANGNYRGRIVEVLLNGRYDAEARLDAVKGWRSFWEALLQPADENETDAAGMIRRVSESFAVRIV